MRGFYTVFDNDNDMIGLAPHSNSEKNALEYVSVQPYKFINGGTWSLWLRMCIGGGILLLIVAIALLCEFEGPKICEWIRRKCMGKDKKKALEEKEQAKEKDDD